MPTIYHRLFIAVPAAKVYEALTSQEGLRAWWTPNTTAKPQLNTVARFPFGEGYFKEMKIEELKPFSSVKWQCIAGTDEWIETSIVFKLVAGDKKTLLNVHPEMNDQLQQDVKSNEGTLLVFEHNNWKDNSPMFAECNYTWAQFLRSLKLFCETSKGRPWPNQHKTE